MGALYCQTKMQYIPDVTQSVYDWVVSALCSMLGLWLKLLACLAGKYNVRNN